jgi:hypothetical protein
MILQIPAKWPSLMLRTGPSMTLRAFAATDHADARCGPEDGWKGDLTWLMQIKYIRVP